MKEFLLFIIAVFIVIVIGDSIQEKAYPDSKGIIRTTIEKIKESL